MFLLQATCPRVVRRWKTCLGLTTNHDRGNGQRSLGFPNGETWGWVVFCSKRSHIGGETGLNAVARKATVVRSRRRGGLRAGGEAASFRDGAQKVAGEAKAQWVSGRVLI